jgi:hypothetical protein
MDVALCSPGEGHARGNGPKLVEWRGADGNFVATDYEGEDGSRFRAPFRPGGSDVPVRRPSSNLTSFVFITVSPYNKYIMVPRRNLSGQRCQ